MICKPKLIYICGMGHNGSTSLDLLLDLLPETVGTSQLNDLLVLYFPDQKPESEVTDRDRFWADLASTLTPEQREVLAKENNSILRERALLRFAFSGKSRRRYAAINEVLIDALLKATSKPVIVDSSKNISRCLGLLETKYDVYVIHLTRDVRGYVESHNKRRGEEGKRPIYFKSTALWFAKNAAASIFVRPKASHYIRLKYEDMMLKPQQFLAALSSFLEMPLDGCHDAITGKAPLRPSQSLGFEGNRVLHMRKDVILDSNRVRTDGLYQSRAYWHSLGWLSCFWNYRFKTD